MTTRQAMNETVTGEGSPLRGVARPGSAPRNFIVFFDDKVGSTALISLLGQFRDVCIVELGSRIGFEPFDRHNCGPMPRRRLRRCLTLVLGGAAVDMAALNRLYMQTGRGELDPIDATRAVGFKMRFRPPWPALADRLPSGVRSRVLRRGVRELRRVLRALHGHSYRRMIFTVLRRHRVVVFVLVRNDLLRWALSRYHGDGTGQPGHLQFKLAEGVISRDDIGTLHVDGDRLDAVVEQCRTDHEAKLRLHAELLAAGVDAHRVTYEDFLHRREQCVRRMLRCIGVEPDDDELSAVLNAELRFRKVHPDGIEAFVDNYEEVMARFGHLVRDESLPAGE